jgi:hypothetical protein
LLIVLPEFFFSSPSEGAYYVAIEVCLRHRLLKTAGLEEEGSREGQTEIEVTAWNHG